MPISFIQRYLKLEAASAIPLMLAAVLAILWANSPYVDAYHVFSQATNFLVNEVLMALFFLVVGLELKRSYRDGTFSQFAQIILPGVAAIGGMVIPALIYFYLNRHNAATLGGWAIPIATDIAFAVGVLSLFGRNIPQSLKLFLLALAIFDDIGGVIIIAVFYSHNVPILWLLAIVTIVLALLLLSSYQLKNNVFYILLGILLWISFYKAHIHPAIAGFVFALFVPDAKTKTASFLRMMEEALHPWVAFFVLPLFALVNAGVTIETISLQLFTDVVVLGVAMGLFVGKQVGVFMFSWIMIQLGFARLPAKSTWLDLYGVALLCGIGFTMSLFLGTLSFPNQNLYLTEVKLGVLVGSLLSGIMGASVIAISIKKSSKQRG